MQILHLAFILSLIVVVRLFLTMNPCHNSDNFHFAEPKPRKDRNQLMCIEYYLNIKLSYLKIKESLICFGCSLTRLSASELMFRSYKSQQFRLKLVQLRH
jgi:hypothetical protein